MGPFESLEVSLLVQCYQPVARRRLLDVQAISKLSGRYRSSGS